MEFPNLLRCGEVSIRMLVLAVVHFLCGWRVAAPCSRRLVCRLSSHPGRENGEDLVHSAAHAGSLAQDGSALCRDALLYLILPSADFDPVLEHRVRQYSLDIPTVSVDVGPLTMPLRNTAWTTTSVIVLASSQAW